MKDLNEINDRVLSCEACPRLRRHCRKIAREKRRQFADWDYWGGPVPSFGDPDARILLLGLAPAAHGANRTGRMFTGDNSGRWLYRSLYRAGLATREESLHRDDDLRLKGVYITGAARCAPPENKPTPAELDRCFPFLLEELACLPRARVLVATGGIAFKVALRLLREAGNEIPRPVPRFGHGSEHRVGRYHLLGTYHPSQQNTFTGRLTEAMLDAVIGRAKALAGL